MSARSPNLAHAVDMAFPDDMSTRATGARSPITARPSSSDRRREGATWPKARENRADRVRRTAESIRRSPVRLSRRRWLSDKLRRRGASAVPIENGASSHALLAQIRNRTRPAADAMCSAILLLHLVADLPQPGQRGEHVGPAARREVEGRPQCGPATPISGVRDPKHVVPRGQQLRRAVGRTVVDDQHLAAVAQGSSRPPMTCCTSWKTGGAASVR